MTFSLPPNIHRVVIFALTIGAFAVSHFWRFTTWPGELGDSVVAFFTLIAGLLQGKPADGGPGAVTRIVGGLQKTGLVILSVLCLTGCGAGSQKTVHQLLDIVDAVDDHAANVLAFIAPHLPEGDAKVAALEAARRARDFGQFFNMAKPVVAKLAEGREGVPREVAADLALGAAAAHAVEQGMRALDGRNPDGTVKAGP